MVQLHAASEMAMGDSASETTATSMMAINMMRFHAGSGDTLWFSPFAPSSSAAVFGACVLLFFVGILSRFIDATQRTMTIVWLNKAVSRTTGENGQDTIRPVPWRPIDDSERGALFLFHSGIQYLLMLAVMTFNVYYFIAVLLGLGVGEAVFGRFGRHAQVVHRNAFERNDSTEKIVNEIE